MVLRDLTNTRHEFYYLQYFIITIILQMGPKGIVQYTSQFFTYSCRIHGSTQLITILMRPNKKFFFSKTGRIQYFMLKHILFIYILYPTVEYTVSNEIKTFFVPIQSTQLPILYMWWIVDKTGHHATIILIYFIQKHN